MKAAPSLPLPLEGRVLREAEWVGSVRPGSDLLPFRPRTAASTPPDRPAAGHPPLEGEGKARAPETFP